MKLIRHIMPIAAALAIIGSGCAKSQESGETTAETSKTTEQQTPAASLDGNTFIVDMKEVGKEESYKDTLIFTGGTFRSTGCDQYGFAPASYAAADKNGMVTCNATAVSEKEGKMDWSGSVQGGKIQGQATWTKEGQASIAYEFNGMVKM